MSDDNLPERPWNEDEWERFLKQSEARADKFGELLETLQDDPNAEEIIAHEMGWDRDDEDGEGEDEDDDPADWEADEEDDEEEDGPFGAGELSDLELAEAEEIVSAKRAALKAMPAYQRSFAFGLAVHEALKPYTEGVDEDEADDDLTDAVGNSFIIAAKIAGAHGMGYDDDTLCGNIVCCRRARDAARKCAKALDELRRRQVVPGETLGPLLQECGEIIVIVEEHIADLRSRVWWS